VSCWALSRLRPPPAELATFKVEEIVEWGGRTVVVDLLGLEDGCGRWPFPLGKQSVDQGTAGAGIMEGPPLLGSEQEIAEAVNSS
jgi:hypothetical protein